MKAVLFNEQKNENQNIDINNEIENKQSENNNINEMKMNNINNKFNYFKNTKDNYDKLFIHEYIENIHLIENNQDIIDKKLNYLKMNKDYYNIKKPELDIKLQLKRQTKNIFMEELSNDNKKESDDSYFKFSPEVFESDDKNKNNLLYKSDELFSIF